MWEWYSWYQWNMLHSITDEYQASPPESADYFYITWDSDMLIAYLPSWR